MFYLNLYLPTLCISWDDSFLFEFTIFDILCRARVMHQPRRLIYLKLRCFWLDLLKVF